MRTATAPTSIELPPLCFRADVQTVDSDKRTAELIFSTGAPVTRYDWATGSRYIEQLSMKAEHVDLARLNASAPLLDSHSAWSISDQIGVVEPGSARIEAGKAMATVRFSKRDAVEPIFQDVRDGILRAVSVGYRVNQVVETQGKNGALATRLATNWTPFEVSLVPMPADIGAKVRGDSAAMNSCLVLRSMNDADRLRRLRLASARF